MRRQAIKEQELNSGHAVSRLWHGYFATSLIKKMTIGFVLGLIVAFAIGPRAHILAPVGTIFIRLLEMIVVPIVFFLLANAIIRTASGKSVARIGMKAITFYMLTTAFATCIGLLISLLMAPGAGVHLPGLKAQHGELPPVADMITGIVPQNIVSALSSPEILPVIFVAVIAAFAIRSLGAANDGVDRKYGVLAADLVSMGNRVTFKILGGILQFAPIGVFALVASQIGDQGVSTLIALGKLTAAIYAGLAVQMFFVYSPIMMMFRIKLRNFFRDSRAALLTAFSTQSSAGTLPVAMEAAEAAGLDETVAGFVLPLGATINMDGAAVRYAAEIVFAANIVGMEFTLGSLALVVLTTVLISVGTGGIPGGGLIGLTVLLGMLNLPIEIVALVAGIDTILGMGCTLLNVTGDLVCAHVVNASELRRKGDG
ncbi:MAG: dicarboxylate/amino acid:cation symporter [Xanthomonadales bacterium]|nr:dicarboxylate/amino acid:cation symporter [Xanthomonadales bacterium]